MKRSWNNKRFIWRNKNIFCQYSSILCFEIYSLCFVSVFCQNQIKFWITHYHVLHFSRCILLLITPFIQISSNIQLTYYWAAVELHTRTILVVKLTHFVEKTFLDIGKKSMYTFHCVISIYMMITTLAIFIISNENVWIFPKQKAFIPRVIIVCMCNVPVK